MGMLKSCGLTLYPPHCILESFEKFFEFRHEFPISLDLFSENWLGVGTRWPETLGQVFTRRRTFALPFTVLQCSSASQNSALSLKA
jgi:hypothetical protein